MLIGVPSLAFASIDTNLKYGARGVEVSELQEFLIDKGLLAGQATGNFFSLTLKAVKLYQASVGLPTTGFVGPLTRAKINTELSIDDSAELGETGTTTPPKQDSTADLLKQQNELLKQQLAAQQKIIENTTKPAPTPPPTQPTPQPVVDIRQKCEPLKVLDNKWEPSKASDGSVQQSDLDKYNRQYQGYLYAERIMICNFTDPDIQLGCQKFLTENVQWLACMNR